MGPLVRPAFGSDFEIVVVGGDSLDGDAPGAAVEAHGGVIPIVPSAVVAAGILGAGGGGEGETQGTEQGKATKGEGHGFMTGPAYPEFRRQATGNREAIVRESRP